MGDTRFAGHKVMGRGDGRNIRKVGMQRFEERQRLGVRNQWDRGAVSTQ